MFLGNTKKSDLHETVIGRRMRECNMYIYVAGSPVENALTHDLSTSFT